VVGIRVDGPLGPFRDGVLEMLRASGYSQDRAVQLVRLMAHLSRWLDDHGLGLGDLSSEAVEEFFGVFRLRHNWCRSSRSLALVLAHLRAAGAVPAAEVKRAAPAAEAGLLGDFRLYLRDQRGLGPGTVDAYARCSRDCIRTWWPDAPIAVAELDARDVISVVRSAMDQRRPATLRAMVTALRSLLRFFQATGMTNQIRRLRARTSRAATTAIPTAPAIRRSIPVRPAVCHPPAQPGTRRRKRPAAPPARPHARRPALSPDPIR
jgi:integrase/recombinase XerD